MPLPELLRLVRTPTADRWSPRRPGYQAEGVTRRVGVHVLSAGQAPRAEREHTSLPLGQIIDHDVEMDLLRLGRVRPPWRLVVGRQLESEPGSRFALRD